MGRNVKEGNPQGKTNREPKPISPEIPVKRYYLRNLVLSYMERGMESDVLTSLRQEGLPKRARSLELQADSEQSINKDTRDVILSLLEIYKLWGDFAYSNKGLPSLGRINLLHTDPDNDNSTLRFYKDRLYNRTPGEITVVGVEPQDYGMGMDTLWMASEFLSISPNGKITLEADYYPGSMGPETSYFTDHPLSANHLMLPLLDVVLNGARMQEQGMLREWTKGIEGQDWTWRRVKPPVFTKK